MSINVKNGMKVCSKCQQFKPIKKFGKNPDTLDGRSSTCIACTVGSLHNKKGRNTQGLKVTKETVKRRKALKNPKKPAKRKK